MHNKPAPDLPGRWESHTLTSNANAMSYFVNHGRGQKPRRVEWRLVCLVAGDQDMTPGDELNIGVIELGANPLSIGSNGAQCWLVANFAINSLVFMGKHSGAAFNPTIARWGFKCIAEW